MNENIVIVFYYYEILRSMNLQHRITNIDVETDVYFLCGFVVMILDVCLCFFTKTLAVHDAEMCRVRHVIFVFLYRFFGVSHPNKQLCLSKITKVIFPISNCALNIVNLGCKVLQFVIIKLTINICLVQYITQDKL